MKKAFPIALMVLGLVFVAGGGYAVFRGLDAKEQVRDELVAQNITLPEDAKELVGATPGARVDDANTAEQMAEIIGIHANESTDGKTYAELGRYLATGGGDTNDAEAAVKGSDGRPVANPIRNVAFQASSLRTSLYTSVMAFNVADLVMGLGLMIGVTGLAVGGLGFALAGLAFPALARRVHVEPIAAQH
ncbi:MAG TPA: hypothetical protein VF230_03340 [Acidimicrobiales bacterium]